MALCRLKASRIFLNESVTALHVELCQVLMTWKVIDLIWQMPVTVEMQWVIHASMSCSKEYLWYWYFHPQSISVVRILQKKKKEKKKNNQWYQLPETLHLQGWMSLLYTRCHQNTDCCLRHIRGGASSLCPAEGTLPLHQDMTTPSPSPKNTRTRVRVVLMF